MNEKTTEEALYSAEATTT